MKRRIFKIGKFLAAGIPSGLLALPLNYILVESAHLNKPTAYAIVLVLQVIINFFICRHFVFEKSSAASLSTQFLQFMGGILGFRTADWLVYSLLVSYFGNYFLALQVFNAILFAWLKFRFSERVLEGKCQKQGYGEQD